MWWTPPLGRQRLTMAGQESSPWWRPWLPTKFSPLDGGGKGKEKGRCNLTRTGRATRLTKRGVGPRRYPTGDMSCWSGSPEPCSPRTQRCIALTRVISTLISTYPNVREYGSFYFLARRLAIRLRVASAPTPRRPSTDAMNGVKCRRSLRQACRYFFFFSFSEVSRQLSVVLDWWDMASVFTTRMSQILSVPCVQKYRIRRSPFSPPLILNYIYN